MIAAWVGDKDLACQQLTIAVRSWRRASYGQLKLLLFRDPLRGDPRFEAIIASLAPKEAAKQVKTYSRPRVFGIGASIQPSLVEEDASHFNSESFRE